MKTCIYWHRNDLRIHDNECLRRCIDEYDVVIPLYVVDPHHYRIVEGGFKKSGVIRYRYLCETIADLRKSYIEIGGNIALKYGDTGEVIKSIVIEYNADAVIYQSEVATEELEDEKAVKTAILDLGVDLISIWGRTLYHLDDIPFEADTIPLTSKAFRINTSNATKPRPLIAKVTKMIVPSEFSWGEMPSEIYLGYSEAEMETPNCNTYEAGETAGLARLQYYTFESELLTSYKWTRNRSLGMDYSSKLSPYLALGSLSPRMIYHEVKRYESEIKRNISTWWLVFEVVWRDFFIFKTLRIGDKLFFKNGFKDKMIEWKYDVTLYDRWRNGKTGIPFLDAHQIELSQTGFMSNRGRVNSASFLTKDYQIDWRWGAAWFEHCLIDYDVYANWMNWHMQTFEMYYTNSVHQAMKYDKDGKYTLHWIPELIALPHKDFHAPFLHSDEDLENYGIKEYNRPVEIYSKWTRSINNIIKARG